MTMLCVFSARADAVRPTKKAPSTKLQAPGKHQAPNPKLRAQSGAGSLVFGASLDLGSWILVLVASAVSTQTVRESTFIKNLTCWMLMVSMLVKELHDLAVSARRDLGVRLAPEAVTAFRDRNEL